MRGHRWTLQHGLITLPKTTKKERLRENADVSGFTISDQHMSELDALDERLVTDWYVFVPIPIVMCTLTDHFDRDPTEAP
jgi:diketogulonate reductase-like aldo/keto reductase